MSKVVARWHFLRLPIGNLNDRFGSKAVSQQFSSPAAAFGHERTLQTQFDVFLESL
jgi:hypothetical protein